MCMIEESLHDGVIRSKNKITIKFYISLTSVLYRSLKKSCISLHVFAIRNYSKELMK
jgi:hypothetical protein